MPKAKSFKRGDIVRLRSGGPNMTVQEEADDEFLCIWFDVRKMQKGFFKAETLFVVKDADLELDDE